MTEKAVSPLNAAARQLKKESRCETAAVTITMPEQFPRRSLNQMNVDCCASIQRPKDQHPTHEHLHLLVILIVRSIEQEKYVEPIANSAVVTR